MCLGIPMRLEKIDGNEGIAVSGGLRRKANISFLKNVRVGDYILIHAGFAIEKVKVAEARRTLRALRDLEM